MTLSVSYLGNTRRSTLIDFVGVLGRKILDIFSGAAAPKACCTVDWATGMVLKLNGSLIMGCSDRS
jgi:hypothetical protein